MGTRFDPADWLARVLPKNFEKSGLLSENLSIKQRYLKALVRATSLSGKEITEEVYKMVDFYEQKEAELKAAGVRAYKQEALNGQALLKQRIKNMLVYTEVQRQKQENKGKMYRWLPSNATNPDPEHALLYGKIFREGTGDKNNNMPGERYGCQCGIEWLDGDDMTADEKIETLKIDFRKNNILPPLSSDHLKKIGAGQRLPVFKRRSLRRNKIAHNELRRKDYDYLMGESLYKPITEPMQDINRKYYWHFIGSVDNGERFSFVLLDTDPKKVDLEIVHALKMNKRGFRKFMRRYKK